MLPIVPSLAFYEASLRALRFIEARSPTGRRFGADPDAMWRTFRGHLTASDRIDLLLRDADAEYPGSFGARVIFALRGVGEDDAFGPVWKHPAPTDADTLWRKIVSEPPAHDVPAVLAACARAWGLTLRPLDVPGLTPSSRLLLAGPSAFASAAAAFARGRDLAWADQVVCVASPPEHRQLAAVSAALLGAKPTRILGATEPLPGDARFDQRIVSDDADPADRALVETRPS
jgi:hypothetical protein